MFSPTDNPTYRALLVGVWGLRIHGVLGLGNTWAPKVCKILAFMAIIMGSGLLLYILLGFR